MSFIVSNSFITHETIVMLQLIKLFQQPMWGAAETRQKKWRGVDCFTVSVVSLLIHSVNETHKVLTASSLACVCMLVKQQHSTRQGAA